MVSKRFGQEFFFFIGQAAAHPTTGNHTRIWTCTLRPGKCTVSFSWVARNKLQVVISLMSFAFCAVSWLLDFLCCGNSCRLRHPLSGRILGTFGAPNPSLTHPFVWLSHKKIDVLKRRWSKQTDNGWQWHQMPRNSEQLFKFEWSVDKWFWKHNLSEMTRSCAASIVRTGAAGQRPRITQIRKRNTE